MFRQQLQPTNLCLSSLPPSLFLNMLWLFADHLREGPAKYGLYYLSLTVCLINQIKFKFSVSFIHTGLCHNCSQLVKPKEETRCTLACSLNKKLLTTGLGYLRHILQETIYWMILSCGSMFPSVL